MHQLFKISYFKFLNEKLSSTHISPFLYIEQKQFWYQNILQFFIFSITLRPEKKFWITLTERTVPSGDLKELKTTKMSVAVILSQSTLHTAKRRLSSEVKGTSLSNSPQLWTISSVAEGKGSSSTKWAIKYGNSQAL